MAPGIVVAGASIMTEQLIPAVRDDIIPAVKDGIISIVKEQFRGVWYLEDDIGKISERVEAYRGVKKIAEKRQFENREAREWLSDLKNVLYDVGDVLCDYRDGVVRAEEDDQGVLTRWMMHAKDGLSLLLCGIPLSCLKDVLRLPLTPRVEIAQRLRSINANLTKVEERRQRLASLADESSDNLDATPLWEYEDQPMIGRDEIKAQIKHVLLEHAATCIEGSTCSKLLVIGIVGVGGMGKTTLAHSIYNDEDVMAAFDFKKWFYVGEKFELKEIMNNIIGNESQLQNEDELRSAMIKKLRERSVLIILDETWCSNSDEWKLLGSSLSEGAKTCVLITTTRNKTVAKAINHESQYYEYELARVSNDTCMQIFKRWAFMGTNAGRSVEFKGFSEEVVEKMKGVPLAAKIIG